jgi:hypothetical protein
VRVRLLQLRVRGAQLLVDVVLVGDVHDDAGHLHDAPRLVADDRRPLLDPHRLSGVRPHDAELRPVLGPLLHRREDHRLPTLPVVGMQYRESRLGLRQRLDAVDPLQVADGRDPVGGRIPLPRHHPRCLERELKPLLTRANRWFVEYARLLGAAPRTVRHSPFDSVARSFPAQ